LVRALFAALRALVARLTIAARFPLASWQNEGDRGTGLL